MKPAPTESSSLPAPLMHLCPRIEVLTAQEAAEFLRLSLNSLYVGIRMHQIPAVRIGRRWLIPRLALEEYLAGRSTVKGEAGSSSGPAAGPQKRTP
jgi:excisionase family DNA binding protein